MIGLVPYFFFLNFFVLVCFVISVMKNQLQGTDASRVNDAINLAKTFALMKLR